jgi:hypothetical protein
VQNHDTDIRDSTKTELQGPRIESGNHTEANREFYRWKAALIISSFEAKQKLQKNNKKTALCASARLVHFSFLLVGPPGFFCLGFTLEKQLILKCSGALLTKR